MNQDKKTSSFLQAINKYAQQQSEAIKLEVEEFKKQEIEKATKEGINDAYRLIQKEIALKKSQIISENAKREQESRTRLFVKRNEIVESVFADVRKRLAEFTNTDAYIDYIKNSANEIAKLFSDNKCVVFVRASDMDKEGIIKSFFADCTVETDESIELGGIKAYCESTSVLADDTFDSKLCDERILFTENSGLKVV